MPRQPAGPIELMLPSCPNPHTIGDTMCPLVDSINTNSKKGGVNGRIPLQVANNNDVELPGVERGPDRAPQQRKILNLDNIQEDDHNRLSTVRKSVSGTGLPDHHLERRLFLATGATQWPD